MTPTTNVRSGKILLLFFLAVSVPLARPNVVGAQTFESCLLAAVPANIAIARLQEFTITGADVVDLADVQGAVDDAIEGLADNVTGEGGEPSRLAELCARLVANEPEVIVPEANCTALTDSVTCDGAEIFSNYQDVVEGLAEDAVPQITNAAKIQELRSIVADIYQAIRLLVEWAIAKAQASGTSGSGGSDSPAIDDALREQATAETQAESCLTGTGEQRACGDAAASFFDSWFNAIIEIIELI